MGNQSDLATDDAYDVMCDKRLDLGDLNFGECAKLLHNIAAHFRMDKRTTNYAISYLDILLREGAT